MSEANLPHWDMTALFPSLESDEFHRAVKAATQEIRELRTLFEERNVRRRSVSEVDGAFVSAFEEVTGRLNVFLDHLKTLHAYVGCFVSTDARNETAKATSSILDTLSVQVNQLRTRYIAWIGSSDRDALLNLSEIARTHEFMLRQAREQSQHQMSEAEEALASELLPPGLIGWAKLHGNLTALVTASVQCGEETRVLPMSEVRALGNHPDRDVRKSAFEAELAAWETAAVPLAAALNGIKGYQRTVRGRRGWPDDVEPTLLNNSVDRPTLEAMQQACAESFPDFRRYMAVKAKALGLDRLAWYDLNAPLGNAARPWPWNEAETFIRENFGAYSPRLAEFADRTFKERWIDAEPHVGKEGGAYCTGLLPGISRVMMNYDGSFMGVSTLAHELGHAYHNLNLADRAPLQRSTPSTLAETASIFCETIAFNAALAHADREERIGLLDTTLQRDLMVVVDIHSRFLFEKAVFERRAERDLTVPEFSALMLDAQRQTYGDDVEPLHPYMWAVKGHYYGPTFYNYPYTFGLLFGLGLYARYVQEPESFRGQYDDFLSCTGMADAATLGERFGVKVREVDFWRSSLDVIRQEIDDLETALA